MAYYQQKVSKNVIPRQVVPRTDELYQEDFPKALFLSALQEEQRTASFLERNVLNLLSAKTRQKSNA